MHRKNSKYIYKFILGECNKKKDFAFKKKEEKKSTLWLK